MTTAIDKEELQELLGLCMKEQKFSILPDKLIEGISNIAYSENNEAIKSILSRVGKALLDASEHIK